MKRSAVVALLVLLLTVTLTSTIPGLAAAGKCSVHSVLEAQLTALTVPLPTVKTVPAPGWNPLPWTVTG